MGVLVTLKNVLFIIRQKGKFSLSGKKELISQTTKGCIDHQVKCTYISPDKECFDHQTKKDVVIR